ncbi:MAG: tetratricopeptide repeat protein [bacterium]|nr:tetratricopeptide repeat protein [bacterium]
MSTRILTATAIILTIIVSINIPAQAFFVAATSKEEIEAQNNKAAVYTPEWDPRYIAIEREMTDAGADLGDYRHLGLEAPILKDSAVRRKILDMFRKYVQQNPTRSEIYMAQYYIALLLDDEIKQDMMLTQLEMKSGQVRWQAVEHYKLMEERYPRFKDLDVILYRHARALFENGNIKEAEPLVEQFISRYPESEYKEVFKYYKARCELNKGNPGDAYRILTMVLDRSDKALDQTALNYYSARSLSEIAARGKWQPDAATLLNRIMQYAEKSLQGNRAYHEDAIALYKESCYTMAAALYPDNDIKSLTARLSAGRSQQMRAQSQALRETIDIVVKDQAYDLAQEHRRLGDIAFKQNSFKAAQEHYYQALTASPEHPEAGYLHYRNGLALAKIKRASEAAREMHKAAYDYPDSQYAEDAHFQLGYILGSAMRHYVEGAREMEEASRRYANKASAPKALFYAGEYYQLANDLQRAKGQYNQLARAYPDDKRSQWAVDLVQKIEEIEAARRARRIEAAKNKTSQDQPLEEDD